MCADTGHAINRAGIYGQPATPFQAIPASHPLYVADIRHGVYRRFTITVRAGRRLKDEGGTPLSGQGGSMR
ncbi:hypothetical protein CBM2615_B50009 [Cupriavidus taiwanensis]|uniref:Uncharacterized protein n=1 Tax=Cupriavidus taiwanensis TaxID=164546 RepID=A0A375E9H1_9BURK|nr:hypothetical protein CBM2614_B40077 [Cupriavidus taiwanensis]SOZ69377.1 hypothetical protein CBM2615_B50009 [Cupriavidus taiwanensis]SOZ72818.1 hypothetical protein CBM2613_B40077 [Cupriavidus taiwanensis]